MNNIVFYTFKKIDNNNWSIVFLNEKNDHKYINNNRDELIKYLKENKNSIFIGANNFISDNFLITSIIKNGNLSDPVTKEDIIKYLPRTLDITEGILRNNLIDFNVMICNNNLPNYYSLNEDEIKKELLSKVTIISEMYKNEERQKFINWKIDLIKKYN